eukprot:Lithocolla_globosa_v1_NODE_1772_length_2347_cov_13.723822.p3 type:complete len:120 gc:universal NODE_1772_length_2347_cov_13.723822:1172-1531(+)
MAVASEILSHRLQNLIDGFNQASSEVIFRDLFVNKSLFNSLIVLELFPSALEHRGLGREHNVLDIIQTRVLKVILDKMEVRMFFFLLSSLLFTHFCKHLLFFHALSLFVFRRRGAVSRH